ncbi:MAG: TonB family protein [Deltaproteobacteria bacterium]|nr:MAG: TonB family protein [Deltaproteobacteria bacterium]
MSRVRTVLALLAAAWVLGLASPASTSAAQLPDELPTTVSVPDPEIPPEARPEEDLVVSLEILIAVDGTVTEARVAKSAGEPYDSAALDAIKHARFAPAKLEGVAVAVWIGFDFTFAGRPHRRSRVVPSRAPRREIEPAPGFVFAGEVVEKGTRAPQAGIPVNVRDPRTGRTWEVLTDADGRFVFRGLPAGRLTLDIFTGGYEPLKKAVRVRSADPEEALRDRDRYYLAPGGLSAYRTVVKEKRPPKAATVIDLNEEELTKVAGTFGDPTRVVASLPGVARSPFGLGYYVVRGAQLDNTGFFIDGHPAIYLYHLLGGPGVIHPELVGSLSFYPGGYPARYGAYAGGIIAVETKDPPRDRWHLDVDLNLFQTGVLFSVPIDDGRGIVTASFRRSYYELLLPLFTDDLSLSFTDYMLRASWDFSPRVRGRFIVLGAEDAAATKGIESSDGGGGKTSSDISLGFHRVNLAFDVDLSRDLTWTTSAVWEYEHTDNSRVAEGDDTIKAGLAGWFAQLRSFVEWRPDKRYGVETGLELTYLSYGADLQIPIGAALGDPRPPLFDPRVIRTTIDSPAWGIAPYVSGDLELTPGLRLLPGVRLSLWKYGDRVQPVLDPKLAVRWTIDDAWTLKGMAAVAHQPPNNFFAAEPFGDPAIPPAESLQGSLGFEWIPAEGWLISFEGFAQYLTNLPQASNALAASGDDEVERTYFDANLRGRAFGAELLLRKEFGGRQYGWLSYTISRAERWRGDERGWGIYELDQTHILNLAWTVRLGREWSLGARFQLTSGNPYYPIVGSRYDADLDRYVPLYAGEAGRLDLYHRLDMRLDKTWRFEDWMFQFYLDIQNVYNAGNPESPRYSYDYAIKTDGISLPFFPTLGFRAVF